MTERACVQCGSGQADDISVKVHTQIHSYTQPLLSWEGGHHEVAIATTT